MSHTTSSTALVYFVFIIGFITGVGLVSGIYLGTHKQILPKLKVVSIHENGILIERNLFIIGSPPANIHVGDTIKLYK